MEELFFEERKEEGFLGERRFVLPTEVFSRYVENIIVRRMYLTDVGYYPKALHHYMERKEGIEEYIFLYCMEGEGVIWTRGKKYILKEREAFCIPRMQAHRYCANEKNPWSILWVHFKGEDTKYYPLEECRVVRFNSASATNRMIHLFHLLFRVLDGMYTLGNFIYISQIVSLIMAETYCRQKQDDALEQNRHVTDIVHYFYNNIGKMLTLDDISREFEVSKSYLNVIFLKYTQHAPIDFLIHLKMQEACKLLRSTNMYIYEIAEYVGYDDQYYFSRIFKKIVGMSPRDYKKKDSFCFEEK